MEGMSRGASAGKGSLSLALAMFAAGTFAAAAAESRYDDEALQSKARARIERQPQLRGLSIGVSVRYGVASLEGHVDSLLQAESARRAVAEVRGLVDLHSSLVVPEGLVGDSELHGDLERELERFPALRQLDLRLTVQEGRAVIEGEVGTAGERRLVLEAARRVDGMRTVDLSRLGVREGRSVGDADVEALVRGLLGDRLRFPIQGRVSARVRDRIAILEGEVQRVIDRLDAEEVAWYVGGVLGVQNLIAVVPRSRIHRALVPQGEGEELVPPRPIRNDPETPEFDDEEDGDDEY